MELAKVLPKLAESAVRFESMMRKASYTVSGHIELLDSRGAVDERMTGVFRVSGYGPKQHIEVVEYFENGEDKTREAREKAAEEERERREHPPDPDEQWKLPFLPGEQPKYVFRIIETDARSPTHARIHFTPKQPGEHMLVGSAWVDVRTGDTLSMGVMPSKTSGFVDYLRVTLEFGESTPSAHAVSKIAFETETSFLFFHKHWRGTARFSGYRTRDGR